MFPCEHDICADRFTQRFRELTQGTTCRDLEEKLGISRSSINAYQNGSRIPKFPAVARIAQAYGVNPMWLMGTDESKYPTAPVPEDAQPIPHLVKVPRLGAIACGQPILAQENLEGSDLVPDWVKCDFTLVCRGDSMIGARIWDGDVVCIHSQPEVENGEIAAVLIEDEATLKRVFVHPDHIVLEPENPSYRPMVFWDADMAKVRILGKATHFISAVR